MRREILRNVGMHFMCFYHMLENDKLYCVPGHDSGVSSKLIFSRLAPSIKTSNFLLKMHFAIFKGTK